MDEAFIYDRKIDNQTYQTQLGMLRKEQALAQMELNEARVDELDTEAVVSFAIEAIGDASRFCLTPQLTKSSGSSTFCFPKACHLTVRTYSKFRRQLSLASQSIPSWNQIMAWLKEMETLRNVAA